MNIHIVIITLARHGMTRTIFHVSGSEAQNQRVVDLIGKTYKGASVTAEHRTIENATPEHAFAFQYSIGAKMI